MTTETLTASHVLLIATVGGSPEPVVATLKHWRPARVTFVVSSETRPRLTEILAAAEAEGVPMPEGAYEDLEIVDAQDFGACIRRLRTLESQVAGWLGRSVGHRIVVDQTGGTKAMSSALALCARRWPCSFSYVAGGERTKGGVGIVVSGTEKVLHVANPWNSLGYQAIEDACVAFDTGAYALAGHYIEEARRKVEDARVKRELSAVHHLVQGYSAWDRFQHQKASQPLEDARANENNLLAALGPHRAEKVLSAVEGHLRHLQQLVGFAGPSRALLVDLLANARRREAEGRFDDTVARLYRATEALAQLTLRERHGIENTSAVPLERVPEPLATNWRHKANKSPRKLGLNDAYALLSALGDPVGKRFEASDLRGETSLLGARNKSILAHGFEPVSRKTCKDFRQELLNLSEIVEAELPEFPRLSVS